MRDSDEAIALQKSVAVVGFFPRMASIRISTTRVSQSSARNHHNKRKCSHYLLHSYHLP